MWMANYGKFNRKQKTVRSLGRGSYLPVLIGIVSLLGAAGGSTQLPLKETMQQTASGVSSPEMWVEDPLDATREADLEKIFQSVKFGNPDAPIQLVVYHSLTCAHCNEFKQNVLKVLIETHAFERDFKDVCIVMRDFPNDVLALQAAQVAWSQRDPEVYKQRLLTFADPKKGLHFETDQYIEEFIKYCTETLKMDPQELEECLQDHELRDAIINQLFADGQKFQIQFIPFYLMNGKSLDQSIDDMKDFRDVIQKARKDGTFQSSSMPHNPKAPTQRG